MTLKEWVSQLFNIRINDWDNGVKILRQYGQWSMSGAPRKFEDMFLELMKRVEVLEEHAERSSARNIDNIQPNK